MEFTFTRLLFTFRLDGNCSNPDALLRLKGTFPAAFQAETGCSGPDCGGCSDGTCPWRATFARELSSDPSAVKRFQKPSLPFVFDLPDIHPLPNRGVELQIGLVLVGNAVNHLVLYIAALKRSFDTSSGDADMSASLVSVASVDAAGVPTLLMHADRTESDRLIILTGADLLAGREQSAERLTVTFVTPLRIVRDGRPLREIAFSDLVRGLLRRMSSLAYYYADAELPLDYRWLSERSAAVATVSADIEWASRRGGWSGVTGRATYAGDVAEFLPLLRLGELFNLGKGAGWGQGRYRTSL